MKKWLKKDIKINLQNKDGKDQEEPKEKNLENKRQK